MKKLSTIPVISILVLTFSLLLVTGVVAAAPANKYSNRPTQSFDRPNLPDKATTHLSGSKLQFCQARENAVKKRSEQLTKYVTTMEEKFDAISSKVQNYYTSKLIPAGKTVGNYDTLVANILNKKSVVQTALTKAQTDISGFSCTGGDPKGILTQFNEDMKSVKQALNDYKTAIKNLIVAVRSVTGEENRANPTK